MNYQRILEHAMNPIQASLKERDLEYQNIILPAKKRARAYQDVPNSLAQESFDYVETKFITKYFNGQLDKYNEYVKEMNNYGRN